LKNRNYTISILNDYSRLDEIYRLTHDTFVLSGEISPKADGVIITCPHLDRHPSTIIFIAELKEKIIGTCTVTIDSEQGLNIESWFDQEIKKYRADSKNKLSSCWRLATIPSYRGSRLLIMDLIEAAFNQSINAGSNIGFFALMNKNIKTYQQIINGKIVATKYVMFDKEISMKLNLMEVNLEEGWKKFQQLKKT